MTINCNVDVNEADMVELDEVAIATKIKKMLPFLNEFQKRIYLASEAEILGYGGVSKISKETGVSRVTISSGIKELNSLDGETSEQLQISLQKERVRNEGCGRKRVEETQPGVKEALESIISESSFGDPQSLLKWTTKSLRNLEQEMNRKGFNLKYRKIGYLLKELGYSLQLNQKMNQVGQEHPDRDEQFKHISSKANSFLEQNFPVISIDCKKKENIGNFKNNGAEYAPKGTPTKVLDHDFPLPELGKAAPYGIYDIGLNEGFVNVGVSSDTAQFAVNSIRSWWYEMGKERYPEARQILITADGGGSNGSRNRLWKYELQQFADETKLAISVCHFPPGTSKWNKIEHRLFSQITKNWRGRPLVSLQVIIDLIAGTTTATGLKVVAKADEKQYSTGIKVSDEEFKSLNIVGDEFHPDWNYTSSPKL